LNNNGFSISSLRHYRFLSLFVFLVLGVSEANGASFQVVYNTPQGPNETDARVFLEEEGVIQTVSDLVNGEFELRDNLSLFMGGGDSPRFEQASNDIYMPYDFVYEAAARFRRDDYSLTKADIYEVTRDAYLHALLHNVSHALFVMYDLRTSGDREKAVDALTVLLLLRYYENGGDIVVNAAELFSNGGGREAQSGTGFWSDHGLDRQSYNQAICLVYGSDPERYAGLRAGSQFLQIRGQECVGEYQRQVNAWFRVLGTFLKRPPPG
jgi:hypothetical protein